MRSRTICRIIWIPSLVALVALLGLNIKAPSAASAPKPLKPFVSEDKVIALHVPSNWKAKQSGVPGGSSVVKISPGGGVVFNITGDIVGSIIADVDRATSAAMAGVPEGVGAMPGMPTRPRKSALQMLHEVQGKKLAEAQADYRDGETRKLMVAGHDALLTPFTFTTVSGFTPTPVVGERATFVGRDLHYSVIYRCRREDEKALLPVLRKMLDSLRVEAQGG